MPMLSSGASTRRDWILRNHLVTYSCMPRVIPRTDPFHAVADPTRRAILDRLRRGAAPATEIAAGFRISRPAVSRHLRVLRDARLVREQRRGGIDGRQRVYELAPAPLTDVAKWIAGYQKFWPSNLANLKRHVEGSTDWTFDRPPEKPQS